MIRISTFCKSSFFLLFFLNLYSQQESQFTQYMYNTSSINPAYAGSRDFAEFSSFYRAQWIGLKGAPRTANIAFTMPVSDKVGLGFLVMNDQIGPSNENLIGIDVSYNIDVSEEYRLFFGMKASCNLLNIDFTKLDIENPNDQLFSNNVRNKFSPNVGVGFYLQSDKSFLGISSPFVLETSHYRDYIASRAKEKMHIYFIGGYVFDLSYDLQFRPSFLVKIVQGSVLQADLSSTFLFNQKFSLGASYRLRQGFSALAGFQLSESLYLGYGFDSSVKSFSGLNSTSHEFMLRFSILNMNYSRFLSPRFF